VIDLKTLLGTGIGVALIIFVLILFNPEKFEKWLALIYKFLALFPRLFRAAHRRYIRYDLQGRINDFTKRLSSRGDFLVHERVKVEWTKGGIDREAFLAQDEVVLRLSRNDPSDLNFIYGAYYFVSKSLIHRMKPYLSDDQRDALDLYVTSELLRTEKDHVLTTFLDLYLHPMTSKPDRSAVVLYFDSLATADKSGLLFTIFLPELYFFSRKVFGDIRRAEVIKEVDDFLAFVVRVAERRLGQDIEMSYYGVYCRVGVVILGKREKIIAGAGPWADYILRALVPRRTESIYVIGPQQNEGLVHNLADSIADDYSLERQSHMTALLPSGGTWLETPAFSAHFRAVGSDVFESRVVRKSEEAEESRVVQSGATSLVSPSKDVVAFVKQFGYGGFGFLIVPTDISETAIYFNRKVCKNAPEFIEKGSLVECDYRQDEGGRWYATRVVFLTSAQDAEK
jgi:hypothetical protein